MASITKAGIARVKSQSSTRSGVGHWKIQRITSIAMVPLFVWFVVSMVGLWGADFEATRAWLAAPLNTTLMLLFVVTTFWHAQLGVQVVFEDYVHDEGLKMAGILGTTFVLIALGVAAAVAILKVSVGG